MPTITDKEFGEITLRRSARANGIRISVAPDGSLRVSSSRFTPLIVVKRSINTSRESIRRLLQNAQTSTIYNHGQRVGKEHVLFVKPASQLHIKTERSVIGVHLPKTINIEQSNVQKLIRTEVAKALRKEAKTHLPKRLDFQASRMQATYQKLRFSHASTRWGSCSSGGTISLNIALMKLPYELIDYVLIHELAHTKHLNHSAAFWDEVARYDADFKKHRQALKNYQPSI